MGAKFNYVKAASTASDIVDFFGTVEVLTRTSTGNINPATGEAQAETSVTLDGTLTPILPTTITSDGGVHTNVGVAYWIGDKVEIGDYFENKRVDRVEVIRSPQVGIIIQKLVFYGGF